MAKKIRPNRPTTPRSVNKTTPGDTSVTVDIVSASGSESSCEEMSYSDNMSPLHSRERLTPTSPSVIVDIESDIEEYKKRDGFRSAMHSFVRLAKAFASPSSGVWSTDMTAMVKQMEERLSEMKEQYAVAFDVSPSEVEKRFAKDPDQFEDSDEEDYDLDDGEFEGEELGTLPATHFIQKMEAASATEKSPARREQVVVPPYMAYVVARIQELSDIRAAEVARRQSQGYHEAVSTGDDIKDSLISHLKQLEGTSKPVHKSPSATAKSSNATDALVADSVTSHAQSLLAKRKVPLATILATALFRFCMDHPKDFTAKDAYNVTRMCSGDGEVALRLYQQAADDPPSLKQALKEWMSSHQDNDDNTASMLRDEANETGVKQAYCESEASDDTAYSAPAQLEKGHQGAADDTCADAVWGTKTVVQHVDDCLNTWCNGRCVEELAHEADSATVHHDSAQLEKDRRAAAAAIWASTFEDIASIQHADTFWIPSCNGECVKRLAHKADSTAPDDGFWGSIDGEAIPTCASGWEDLKTASDIDEHDIPDDTADDSAAKLPEPTDYIVTYWATIEHEGQAVHIPIDSSNVSGPEKFIIEGSAGMNKVWKWVQEKGLTDKISLQDAFDLAKDMQVEAPTAEESRKEESDGGDDSEYVPSSSSGSSSCTAPSSKHPSNKAPSPPGDLWGRTPSPRVSVFESLWGEVPAPHDWPTSKTILGYAR